MDEQFFRSAVDHLEEGVYFVDLARRITFWNASAERITGFSRLEVVGRSCKDGILVHVDDEGNSLCNGMCPLAKTMADGRTRETLVYCHHRDGHRRPVTVRTAPVRDPAGKIVGGVEIFDDVASKAASRREVDELQRLALYDPLTGVGNRRYVEINLTSKLDELKRFGWEFGVLFLDLDRFKRINDRHGHAAGDATLEVIARTLMANSRATDLVGRWGGDEFVILLGALHEGELPPLAHRLRSLVGASRVPLDSGTLAVTASVGATLARRDDDVAKLVARADALMYQSKQAGRNEVSFDPPLPRPISPRRSPPDR